MTEIQERDEMLRNEGREEVFARLDGLARERLVEKLREHFDTTDYEDRTFAQLKRLEKANRDANDKLRHVRAKLEEIQHANDKLRHDLAKLQAELARD